MAGVSRLQYATDMRLIRVMCTGRIDLSFVLRAFSKGADGVFIVGCRLNECNYITAGNFDALGNVHLCKKLLDRIEVNPERLRIEFMSAGEGNLFAAFMSDFANQIKELGPLGTSEGINENVLKFKLDAVNALVPYLRLVERERLRVPLKSQEAYEEFFAGEEVNRVFDELIGDKLAISQITSLLREKPLSTSEISATLGLNPSEVSRHMSSSSRQGLVRYDESRKCYMLA